MAVRKKKPVSNKSVTRWVLTACGSLDQVEEEFKTEKEALAELETYLQDGCEYHVLEVEVKKKYSGKIVTVAQGITEGNYDN